MSTILRRLRKRPGALFLFMVGVVLLSLLHVYVDEFEILNRYFYPLVWWTFILTLDAFNAIWGRSILVGRSWSGVLEIAGLSMFMWFIFEVYNLYLANWFYVNASPSRLIHWPLVAVSFATVLPGMWAVQHGVEQPFPDGWLQGDGITVPSRFETGLLVVGLVGSVGPFLVPDYTFPLVWVGLGLIVDVLRRRRDKTSFLGEIEEGNYRPLVTWMIAGGVCGVLWEFWNSLTVVHWIYTVPYLEDWRLFEMPLVGYLGFVPFAPMTWRLYTYIRDYYRRWATAGRGVFWTGVFAFSLLTLFGMHHHTVVSHYPDIQQFAGWTPSQRKTLARQNLHSPWQTLLTIRAPDIRRKVTFLRFAGFGTTVGNCLWRNGVHSVRALRNQPPSQLARWLQQCEGGRRDVWHRRVLDWQHRSPRPRVILFP